MKLEDVGFSKLKAMLGQQGTFKVISLLQRLG